jgi:hypothetical protein
MIYHLYFQLVNSSRAMYRYSPIPEYAKYGDMKERPWLDARGYIGHRIKKSSNDSFVFILTKTQEPHFLKFLEDYELKDLIVKESPWITNHNYPENPKNLKIFILQSEDHFQRKESKDGVG